MNLVEQIISRNNLQPADVVVLKKKFFGMVDHFAVFLGWNADRKPVFAANYTKGTQYIMGTDLDGFLQTLEPQRIERFAGDTFQRQLAVERAMQKIGENNYSYINNNCEHYKNFVQSGHPHSEQVTNIGNGIAAGALFALFGALLIEAFD